MRWIMWMLLWLSCLVLGADMLRSLEAGHWTPLRLYHVGVSVLELTAAAVTGPFAMLLAVPLVAVPLLLAGLFALLARRRRRAHRRRAWR